MKILIAEDDPSLRRVLTALLEKNSYSVDAVGDGEEALEYLRIGSYDGVILDIMMPKMDGCAHGYSPGEKHGSRFNADCKIGD